jgi:nitroimidazol reductase NimA-like FMN-containing flavoprotein (pyridoxamine 5'-phosphate oxidase superfamily)
MFRQMRRKRQELSETEAIAMLESCTSGVLAVHGDDDYPYAVPLSFAYEDGKLFFHCATVGHKLDAVKRDEKASFCVIAELAMEHMTGKASIELITEGA